MKVSICSHRPLLTPCTLEDFEFQLDPYIGCTHNCHYCYALNQAETDWSNEIQIHRDIVEQLNHELAEIPPQNIYIGWNADSYQQSEITYNQTRRVLELLLEKGFSVTILTKSDLIVRDIDLLKKMKNASVGISFAFNEETRPIFEGNTICNNARLTALSKLKEAGIDTYAMICPVFPYITDIKSLINILTPHSNAIWIYSLSMIGHSDLNWLNTQAILQSHFPELKERIEAAAFLPQHPYWIELREDLEKLRTEKQVPLKICL
ncbi:MAG TPA: radical SAM protein [Victivallales bacterium]|nr:radical SAM protein [Victivallales bacterium]